MNTRQRKAIEAVVELGGEPSGELPATELARRIDVSRESVHQLLLPLVRAGLVLALRGRGGGYRAAESLPGTPLSEVMAPFEPPASRRSEGRLRAIDALEEEAESARRTVYEECSVGALLARVRAERAVPTWDI